MLNLTFKWRKWNNILHRDIGYVIAALTLIYGISGLAVNHATDWNPNYKIEKEFVKIDPITSTDREAMVADARKRLNLADEPRNIFRPDRETLQLFFEGKTYSVDLPTGNVLVESTTPRRVLFEMNQLHLNAPKKAWTYIADLYALSLISMALTGMFMLRGKTGIAGRGAWLTTIGVLVPVLYWLYYTFA